MRQGGVGMEYAALPSKTPFANGTGTGYKGSDGTDHCQ
jgi:hypothetical protein